MFKKFSVLILALCSVMLLASCSANVDLEKQGNDLGVSISFDNDELKARDSDISKFENAGFEADLDKDKNILTVSDNFNILNMSKDFDDAKVKFIEVMSQINPDIIEGLDVDKIHLVNNLYGFSFSGVRDISITYDNGDFEIPISVVSDTKTVIGDNKNMAGEENNGVITNDSTLTFIDNDNIKNAKITTNIDKNYISSTVEISFNKKIDAGYAESTLKNNSRIYGYNIDDYNVSFVFEYTTPEMFNKLHSQDIYNATGYLLWANLEDRGIYMNKGSLEITLVEGGDSNIYYSAEKSGNFVGDVPSLEAGKTAIINYSYSDMTGFILTGVVVIAMATVICGFIVLAKKKK